MGFNSGFKGLILNSMFYRKLQYITAPNRVLFNPVGFELISLHLQGFLKTHTLSSQTNITSHKISG